MDYSNPHYPIYMQKTYIKTYIFPTRFRILLMILLYLDPGSGSFLIQLLIAGLAGAGIAIAISWGRIKRLFKKKQAG
jgi:hypothetical protein